MSPRKEDPLMVAIEVLERLPELVRLKLWQEGLSAREASKKAGVSFSTLSRYQNGQSVPTKAVLPVLRWLTGKRGSTNG